jgi:ribosome-binding protein aMBF1 (putative translation factor)
MSVAAKMRLIEISIRDGSKRKLFLVSADKAGAIETLIRDVEKNEDGDELHDIGEAFPELRDPEQRRFITFRSIRTKTGLTQLQLAEKLGISQADVSKIERGKRTIGKALAKKIEKEFGIDYRRFL